jgi:hypothetical protein
MLTAKKNYGFEPDYAIPPGETLKEVMESLNMSQKAQMVRLKRPYLLIGLLEGCNWKEKL